MINVSDKKTKKTYTQVNSYNELKNWILNEGIKTKGNVVITEIKKNLNELKNNKK